MDGGACRTGAVAILVGVWDGLAEWWGAVELWLAQQWFPVQFALIMIVIVPLCVGMTVLVDRIGDALGAWQRRRRVARGSTRRSA